MTPRAYLVALIAAGALACTPVTPSPLRLALLTSSSTPEHDACVRRATARVTAQTAYPETIAARVVRLCRAVEGR